MTKRSQKLANMIVATNGKFFKVQFIKRDGSVRDMTARTGVRRHLRGGGMSFDPSDKDMIVVFDSVKRDYRMVNLKTMQSFRCGATKWRKS